MSVDKKIPDIPQAVIESLARTILPSIRKYFESEKGQKEFAKWKTEKDNKEVRMKKTD